MCHSQFPKGCGSTQGCLVNRTLGTGSVHFPGNVDEESVSNVLREKMKRLEENKVAPLFSRDSWYSSTLESKVTNLKAWHIAENVLLCASLKKSNA